MLYISIDDGKINVSLAIMIALATNSFARHTYMYTTWYTCNSYLFIPMVDFIQIVEIQLRFNVLFTVEGNKRHLYKV